MFENVETIYSYTAEEAVEDGVLVDVSEMGKEAGFKWPVRISQSVHTLCTPPKSNKIQSYDGRLWDVLWMGFIAIKRAKNTTPGSIIKYRVKIGRKLHTLWITIDGTCGPAIHIILPEDY